MRPRERQETGEQEAMRRCVTAGSRNPFCRWKLSWCVSAGITVLKMGVWPPGAGLQGQASNHPRATAFQKARW